MTNPNLVNTSQVYMRSNVQLPINTSATDILETPAASNMIIRADTVTICNTTSSAVSVDVYLTRSSVTYAIAKTIEVPAYSSLVALDKDYPVYLEEGDKLQVQASAWGLHAICAYTIISDTSITLPTRPTIRTIYSYASTPASSDTITLNVPTNASLGDILVAIIAETDGRTATTPTGWTLQATNEGQVGNAGMWIYTRTYQSGDSTWDWILSSSASSGGAIISISKNTFDTISTVYAGGSSTTIPIPTITIANDN